MMTEYVVNVLPLELEGYATPELGVLAGFYQDIQLDVQRGAQRLISAMLLRTDEDEVNGLVTDAVRVMKGRRGGDGKKGASSSSVVSSEWAGAVFMLGILGTQYPSLLEEPVTREVVSGLKTLATQGPLSFRATAVSLLAAVVVPWERVLSAEDAVRLITHALEAAPMGSRYQKACAEALHNISVSVPQVYVRTLSGIVLGSKRETGDLPSVGLRVFAVHLLERAVASSASIFESEVGFLVATIMALVAGERSLQDQSVVDGCTRLLAQVVEVYPEVDGDAGTNKLAGPSPSSPSVIRVWDASKGSKLYDIPASDTRGTVSAISFCPGSGGKSLAYVVLEANRVVVVNETSPLFGGKRGKVRHVFSLDQDLAAVATAPRNEILQSASLSWLTSTTLCVHALAGSEYVFDLP